MSSSGPCRRVVVWISLFVYALVASGLPLPLGTQDGSNAARLAEKDRSKPFPCMNKPCGCGSAKQCFAKCCCHTAAERLAWARARRVEDSILRDLERQTAEEESPRKSAEQPCCAKRAPSGSRVDHDGPQICSEYRSLAITKDTTPGPSADTDAPPAKAPPKRSIVLRAMLACSGIAAEWCSCGISVPPPLAPVAVTTCEPMSETVELADHPILSVDVTIDPPPPRA
jgi:hypothetical protein